MSGVPPHPLVAKVERSFGGTLASSHARLGDATVEVEVSEWLVLMRVLREEPTLDFSMLMDLTAVDRLPRCPRFELVVHLYSLRHGHRLRVRTRLAEEAAVAPSLVSLWPSANWMEREVFDLYGIRFEGHPDLRRILLYEGFEGHPLRKDYPKTRRQPLIGPGR